MSGGLAALKVRKGMWLGGAATTLEPGARALFAQEIRNARGGNYTFTVTASGDGESADDYKTLLAHVSYRLVLFRFRDQAKHPLNADVFAAQEFVPAFGKAEAFKLDKFLGSTVPDVNFAIGNGLGVGVIAERKTAGRVVISNPAATRVRVHSLSLEFSAQPRNDSVTA
jgi:hypothetical protein